ncbi:hypothetical protein [Natrinema versiforme]|uniref:Uncharacterized protein n=1 Tax=Natrinema versiforme TaxID=88724 RepID=A0A4P8WIT6_9EURY|nr:hypothetical protein [Natrinema versiforme]QCS41933.1 hypothetical protein FEJ81_06020 [Natrinema versiforme]
MSDDRSTAAATDENGAADETNEADSGDALEPNGGPQRVVSEESVDDILDSLDSTKSASATSVSTDSSATETVTTTTAEADPDPGPDTDADESPSPTSASASSDTESTDGAEASFDEPGSSPESTENAESDPEPSAVDSAAASLPDDIADDSPEDLAARVEQGDVTGADVRAAEAGEGRESTPEIDDVELSMDDLETTRAGGANGADVADDAGPLAGSVDPDDGPATDDDEDDSSGLIGKIKGFFSR